MFGDGLANRICTRTIGILAVAAPIFLAIATPAVAQRISSGSIAGTVTDSSAAVLPGVTVTATSPALQVPQLVTVTDPTGFYRLTDLPAGVYSIRYELAGFQAIRRDDLQLSVGFAARVDVSLKIGAVEETLTVTGASPIVDVTTTRGGQTLSSDLVNKEIPITHTYADIVRVTPGMRVSTTPNIGVLGNAALTSFSAYGQSGNDQVMIDGVESPSNTFPDFSTAQEIDIKTFGNSADVASPGVVFNMVMKSGGNEFHGRESEQFMNHSLQANNVDDRLRAQGLGTGDAVRHYNDLNGELGGRIIRDKLWFFGALRDRRNQRSVAGFALNAGPDGQYGTGDEPPFLPEASTTNGTIKLSYQLAPKYQIIGFYTRERTLDGGTLGTKGAARFVPYESASTLYYNPRNWKVEFRGTPSNHVIYDAQFGRSMYLADYQDKPGTDTVPARWDRETQIFTGGSITQSGAFGQTNRPRNRLQSTGSASFLPDTFLGGHHLFKVGYRLWLQDTETREPNHAAGNYQLTYDVVSGLHHQPVEIQVFNFPVTPFNKMNTYSLFVTDSWKVGNRLTFNLGTRWDGSHAFLPAQTKQAGQFSAGGTFAALDVNRWNALAPRAAFALDVTGNGKSVVKGTYGWYNHDLPEAFAEVYNPNNAVVTTYRWHDLNGNNDYDAGEVNLDTNGPDFISITGSANNIINSSLRLPHTHEITGSFEHELMPNTSARALYVYRHIVDDYQDVNILRPYAVFNSQIIRVDPGPDGVNATADDGGNVTVYDYPVTYRGTAFVGNQRTNRPSGREDHYQTLEFTLNKRSAGRWGVLTSFSATKNHRWLAGIPQSPNDDYFPIDTTWAWGYKASGNYRLPYDVQFGAVLDLQNGAYGQRTYTFRSIPQSSTVTLRLEPFGAEKGPMRSLLNFRASKVFKFGTRNVQIDADALNAFNSNTAWIQTYVSGPTYGYVTQIVSPRVLRLGVAYEF
jgi:Carboxypeptidase regulatory-like domain